MYLLVSLLAVVLVNGYTDEFCPRDESALARRIIHRRFVHYMETHEVALTPQCDWRFEQDFYHIHEVAKSHVRDDNYRCESCGKHFISDHFINGHMLRKHPIIVDKFAIPGRVCFADYCSLVRCRVFRGDPYPEDCSEIVMFALRQRCATTVKECLPVSLMSHDAFIHLYRELNSSLCDQLTCARRNSGDPPPPDHLTIAFVVIMVAILMSIGIVVFLCCAEYCIDGEDNEDLISKYSHHHIRTETTNTRRRKYISSGHSTNKRSKFNDFVEKKREDEQDLRPVMFPDT